MAMNFKAPKRQDVADLAVKREIPKYISEDLCFLESLYQNENKLDKTIFSFFAKQPNCYEYALDLMSHTKDFSRGRSWSLSRLVMDAFASWCQVNNVSWMLTPQLKAKALYKVLKQQNGNLVELVCDIFKMKEDTEYFKQIIEELIANRKYREVYYTIIALNLQKEFSLSKVALPLFFLDKAVWLINLLKDIPELQLQLIKTLDSVSANSQNIVDLVSSLNVNNVRKHVYETNWIQKRIAHLIDVFNIPITECPNLYHSRKSGAMNYLIRKRYIEQSISAEPWEELITDIVADSTVLEKELVIRISCLNDFEMALHLAVKFNVNKNEWPSSLHSFYYSSMNNCYDSPQRTWNQDPFDEKDELCLTLRLKMSDIQLVNDKQKFINAVEDISQNYNVVGVDAEWKPNLGISKERIALLQLAVWDTVYLLDILALENCLNQDAWDFMMNSIFCNPDILKLGYGVQNDLRMLVKIFNSEKADLLKYSQVIDTGEFFMKVKKLYPSIMDFVSKEISSEEHKGLSQLCLTILGKPLNKEEQFSNWERRPLREKQLIYAALDAFCLLLIYEKLYHILKEMKLTFEDIISMPVTPSVKSQKKKEKSPNKIQHLPIQITDFKVVVDSMLHGLGKYLRLYGADVVIIQNNEDHMNAIKIAQPENRIILTSGGPYKKLKGYMPEDTCFYVPDCMAIQEQLAFVIKYFNVQLSEADIFSRCSVCNGNHYLNVPSEDLYILWSNRVPSEENNIVDTQTAELELKPCFVYEDGFITEKGILHTGVPVQLHFLSIQVLQRIQLFFICSKCGKVYWEGSHFKRIKKFISDFVTISEDPKGNVYQALSKNNSEELLKDQTEVDLDSMPGCVIPDAASNSNAETIDEMPNSSSANTNHSDISVQRQRYTMQFDVDSDHNSDYDSDELVYYN